jgi:hypothetical protein
VPSAFRPEIILGYENREYTRIAAETPQATWDQGNAEWVALMEFLRLADEVGLDVPADHRWLRLWNPFHNVVGNGIGIQEWPPSELYEALAIAQHHGVPTRLLDFSYDPFVAAYFAAEQPPGEPDEIAVWCVDRQMIALTVSSHHHCGIEFVNVPRVRNKNLAAQRALFLLDLGVSRVPYTSLENRIAELVRRAEQLGRVPAGSCAVRKFSLPTSQCGTLLDLLRKLGIDRAHLMTSFDGVVRELESRRRRRVPYQIPVVGSGH